MQTPKKICAFAIWPHLRIRCQPGYPRPCFPHNIFENLTTGLYPLS